MSRTDACPKDGYQVEPVTIWHFLWSFFHLCISFRQNKFEVESFIGGLLRLSLHWKSFLTLQVPYSYSQASWLRLPALTPEILPYPLFLGLTRDYHHHHHNHEDHHNFRSCRFFSFSWPTRSFPSVYLNLILPFHSLPSALPHSSLSPSPMTILFPPLSMIQVFLLGPFFVNFFESVGCFP